MKASLLAAALLAAFSTATLAQTKGGGGSTSGGSAGVITIDQAKAEAGGVTPGDAPGFPVHITQPGHYRLMGNSPSRIRTSRRSRSPAATTDEDAP